MSQTVLQRIAAGDPKAVDECIDRYGGLVWSLARRHLRQHADAEDAVQEIFVELWRSASRFDPAIASEATFITMVSRRRLIDRQRRQSRAPASEPIVEEPVAEPRRGDPLADPDLGDEVDRARRAMGQLRPEERQVLELALVEGLTQREIAEAAKMPLGTVKTHARRGLIRLRALLGADHAADLLEEPR